MLDLFHHQEIRLALCVFAQLCPPKWCITDNLLCLSLLRLSLHSARSLVSEYYTEFYQSLQHS